MCRQRLWPSIIVLCAAAVLAGCVAVMLPTDRFEAEKGQAVMLVGINGDEGITLFNLAESNNVVECGAETKKGVFAIKWDVGKPFGIHRIVANSSIRGAYREAYIDKPPMLTPTREAIFYYAAISSVRGRVVLDETPGPELTSMARKKYENVFRVLKPANFQ